MADIALSIVNTAKLKALGLTGIDPLALGVEPEYDFWLEVKAAKEGPVALPNQRIQLEVESDATDAPQIYNDALSMWVQTVTAPTGGDGVARFHVRSVTLTGTFRITASVANPDAARATPLTVSLRVVAPPRVDNTDKVNQLVIKRGDGQAAFAGSTRFSDVLEVEALNASAKVIESATVEFQITGTTGAHFSGKTTGSDSTSRNGVAMLELTPGDHSGEFEVVATSNGHKQTFHLAILPAPGDLYIAVSTDKTDEVQNISMDAVKQMNLRLQLRQKLTKTPWPYVTFAASLDQRSPFTVQPGSTKASGPLPVDSTKWATLGLGAAGVGSGELTIELVIPSAQPLVITQVKVNKSI